MALIVRINAVAYEYPGVLVPDFILPSPRFLPTTTIVGGSVSARAEKVFRGV